MSIFELSMLTYSGKSPLEDCKNDDVALKDKTCKSSLTPLAVRRPREDLAAAFTYLTGG